MSNYFDINSLTEEEKKNLVIICVHCKVSIRGYFVISDHQCEKGKEVDPEFVVVAHPQAFPEDLTFRIVGMENPAANENDIFEWNDDATKSLIHFYHARRNEFKNTWQVAQFWNDITTDLHRLGYKVNVAQVQAKCDALFELYRKCSENSRGETFEYYDLMKKIFCAHSDTSNEPENALAPAQATSTSRSSDEDESSTNRKRRRASSTVALDLGDRWLAYLQKARESEEAQIEYLKRKGELEQVRLEIEKEKLATMRRNVEQKERQMREEEKIRKEGMEIRKERLRLLKKMVEKLL